METLKIVKNQPFVLWIPTIMLNANGEQAVEADSLKDVVINAGSGCESYEIEHHAYKHWLVLEFGDNLKVGPYKITITGSLSSGRKFNLALAKPIEIVNWDYESNWDRFIVGDHIELTDHPFITGEFLTDTELEQLKEQLRQEIAAAQDEKEAYEAAKEVFEQKAAELEGIARETTSQEILTTVQGIDTSDLAKEATLQDVSDKVDNIALSADTLQSLSDSWAAMVTNRSSLDGYEFVSDFTPNGVGDILLNRSKLIKIVDNTTQVLGHNFVSSVGFTNLVWLEVNEAVGQISFSAGFVRYLKELRYVKFAKATSVGYNGILECSSLEIIELPSVTSIEGNAAIYSLPQCREIHMPKVSTFGTGVNLLASCPRLILLELGSISTSFSLFYWSPNEALLNNSQTLLTDEDIAAGFTNNLEKLLYNIREHIAANLPVAPNTITFSAAVKAAILADQETADAFTNKGWTIA